MKNENVICVSVPDMKEAFGLEEQSWEIEKRSLNQLKYDYIQREDAEKDFGYKQLIPYAVVKGQDGKVLVYQRCGSEKRLSDRYSVGIGGHVNDKDIGETLYDRLISGLKREFEEEIGVRLVDEQIKLLGMINEEQTEVGYCHTGIVFYIQIDNSDLRYDVEIGNPQWKTLQEMDMSKFELWSSLALTLVEKYK